MPDGLQNVLAQVLPHPANAFAFDDEIGIDTVRLVPTARVLKEEFGFRTLASVPGQKTRYDAGSEYTDE